MGIEEKKPSQLREEMTSAKENVVDWLKVFQDAPDAEVPEVLDSKNEELEKKAEDWTSKKVQEMARQEIHYMYGLRRNGTEWDDAQKEIAAKMRESYEKGNGWTEALNKAFGELVDINVQAEAIGKDSFIGLSSIEKPSMLGEDEGERVTSNWLVVAKGNNAQGGLIFNNENDPPRKVKILQEEENYIVFGATFPPYDESWHPNPDEPRDPNISEMLYIYRVDFNQEEEHFTGSTNLKMIEAYQY